MVALPRILLVVATPDLLVLRLVETVLAPDQFWDQCYKTFYGRNLQIFILSISFSSHYLQAFILIAIYECL